jgi:drug/metabolite transporter (DMT)-like permease
LTIIWGKQPDVKEQMKTEIGVESNASAHLTSLSGLGAILLWSTTIALARSLSEQTGALAAAAAVYGSGGLICLVRLCWRQNPVRYARRLPLKYLLGCGALFVAYTISLYLAVGMAADREQALVVGLLNYFWPTLTVLLSLPILGKKGSLLLLPGTLLTLGGTVLVVTQGNALSWSTFWTGLGANPVAYSLALVAAVLWALYSNLARRWSRSGGDNGAWLFIPAAGVALSITWLSLARPVSWTAQAAGEAITLGVLTTAAYALWDTAMRRGNVTAVAACSYLTPLLSTLVSCAYLGLRASAGLWVGCGLIVAGSLLSWRSVSD